MNLNHKIPLNILFKTFCLIFLHKRKTMNPFYIRGYHGEEYFCDREAETQSIISAVKNQRSITLTSLRKMGKTGLILNVGEKLKGDDFHLVYLDILVPFL